MSKLSTIVPKYSLVWSPLSDRVFWVDGQKKRTDVTNNFYNVLMWMVEDAKDGGGFKINMDTDDKKYILKVTKELRVDDEADNS